MKTKTLFFLLILSINLAPQSALSQSEPLPTDRGRVQVMTKKQGKTVVTDENTLLRGGAVWVCKYCSLDENTDLVHDTEFWQLMKDHGINAVRVICFDPWQKDAGYIHMDIDDPNDVEDFLNNLDIAVNMASQYGMYAVINYHSVGMYDMGYLVKFWNIVAPRYKDRTHVLYEITNEPVSWFAGNYEQHHLKDFKQVYDQIKKDAPNTHQVLLSFANTYEGSGKTMKTVADSLSEMGLGIDWTNASVGFHPYYTGATSKHIVELMNAYPCMSTESNFPSDADIIGSDGVYSTSMDSEWLVTETLERLGLSWFHWLIEGSKKFNHNFIGVLESDAKEKGYWWQSDTAGVNIINLPPRAIFSVSGTDWYAPFTVTFDASNSFDHDGDITITWDFGDGTTGKGKITEHTYEEPGLYNPICIVTDRKGWRDTQVLQGGINVRQPNTPPDTLRNSKILQIQ